MANHKSLFGTRMKVTNWQIVLQIIFKSPYHLEIPPEVLQMKFDVWNLLQNNSGWDGKWERTHMSQHRCMLTAAEGDGHMELHYIIFFLCVV